MLDLVCQLYLYKRMLHVAFILYKILVGIMYCLGLFTTLAEAPGISLVIYQQQKQ